MPNFYMSIPHQLSQDEVLRRIKNRLGQLKTQHADKIGDLQENWNGNVGTFIGSAKGMAVSGTLVVGPSEVVLQATLPFALSFFKGKIESRIRAEAAALLG